MDTLVAVLDAFAAVVFVTDPVALVGLAMVAFVTDPVEFEAFAVELSEFTMFMILEVIFVDCPTPAV